MVRVLGNVHCVAIYGEDEHRHPSGGGLLHGDGHSQQNDPAKRDCRVSVLAIPRNVSRVFAACGLDWLRHCVVTVASTALGRGGGGGDKDSESLQVPRLKPIDWPFAMFKHSTPQQKTSFP
jgi:hypothetical protein